MLDTLSPPQKMSDPIKEALSRGVKRKKTETERRQRQKEDKREE